jgi:hypothetical protein
MVTLVALAALVCIGLALLVAGRPRGPEIALTTPTAEPLTDNQAVELSREALRRSGHVAEKFAPQRFQSDNTNYYARNTITPYSGHVCWSSLSWGSTNPGNEAFIVNLEQHGTQVLCNVCRPK